MSPNALRLTTVPAGCCWVAASLHLLVMLPKAFRADFSVEPCLEGACKAEAGFSLKAVCSSGPLMLFSSLMAAVTCTPCI
ncbi:hypothetical protein COO60DRAFT_1502840 [Scenedesmus sp. NREL 46B-D3]|nr:hypothetical protein COO60DRAFT_1502840 [Scenedesmus sp. NREL 46B-D3]